MSTDLFEAINGHDVLGARANSNGHVVVTKPSRMPRMGWLNLSALLLAGASVLLAGLAVTQGYVSWHQQFVFVLAEKHQPAAAALEAIGLDAGAVIFAVLGVALARLGRPALIERALIIGCALGSMLMNLLGADLGSPRSVAVYVLPPLLFAAGSDRLIAVIRRSALGPAEDDATGRSAWRAAGRASLYLVRFVLAPPSTATGVRRMVLIAAPLPAAAAVTAPEPVPAIEAGGPQQRARHRQPGPVTAARTGTKTAQFLALVEEKHGGLAAVPLDAVSRICAELAGEVGLNAGAARTALRAAVLAAQNGGESA